MTKRKIRDHADAHACLALQGADAEALLTEVLRAAFASRTQTPLDALKQAVDAPGLVP